MEIVRSHFVVEEDIGEIKIPMRRTGDNSQRLYVSCVTNSHAEEGMTGTGQCKTGFKIERIPIIPSFRTSPSLPMDSSVDTFTWLT